jgi:hypothetical protein
VIACIEDPPLIAKILAHVQRRLALFDSTPRAPPGPTTATEPHLTRLGPSPGTNAAARCVFGFPCSFPRPLGGQLGTLVPVHSPAAWISRPNRSAILAGIRQLVVYFSSYRRRNWQITAVCSAW